MSRTLFSFALVLLVGGFGCHASAPSGTPANKWSADVEKLVAADAVGGVKPGGVVFVGSSTIRLWDLKASFPELDAVNHGFGGSQMVDAAVFEKPLVSSLKPRLVVLYDGDNDINAGLSPQDVFESFERFATSLHRESPASKLIVLAAKPSPSRIGKYPEMQKANRLMAQYASGTNWIRFVDLGPLLLDEQGNPKPELFKPDRLHMNDDGYKLWSDRLAPMLAK